MVAWSATVAPRCLAGKPTMRIHLSRFIVPVLLLSALPLAWADSWPGPRVVNVFSGNGQYFVRILPGKSVGDTFGFAGAAKGPYARAEFYARQPDRSYQLVADVSLKNPVAPIDAIVSNQGDLLTFDNWHNLGYGKVVAIYDREGMNVAAYELEALYDETKIKKIPRSVSSRWWRCSPHGFSNPEGQAKVYVTERLGGAFVFDLKTGKFEYNPGKATCGEVGGPLSYTSF